MTALTQTWVDDDGSGTVGTILNNAQLQTLYQNLGRMFHGFGAGGRLSLTSGTPVTPGDVTGATTVYYTPYLGDVILLYDGAGTWVPVSFSETSFAVPGTTSTIYDVFGYNNSGTLALETLAWTNDTTRATALTTQHGIYVKTGATTRRYLGSFRTTGSSGQTEDSAAKRYLWNYYNRVPRSVQITDATASWNYSTATWRQARATAANQVDILLGVAEQTLALHLLVGAKNDSGSTVWMNCGILQDATSGTPDATGASEVNAATLVHQFGAQTLYSPAIGRHFYAWMEASQAVANTTWFGTNTTVGGNTQTSRLMGLNWVA